MNIASDIKSTFARIFAPKTGIAFVTVNLETQTVIGVAGDNPDDEKNFLSAGVQACSCFGENGDIYFEPKTVSWCDHKGEPLWHVGRNPNPSLKYKSFRLNLTEELKEYRNANTLN